MLSVEEIRERLAFGRYTLSGHALKRIVQRDIPGELIRRAGAAAEMIDKIITLYVPDPKEWIDNRVRRSRP
ncbi:MAG: hypothetical protein AB1716_01265 [Planctomycetota bacterium]